MSLKLQRFGNALVPSGKLNLKQQKFEKDFQPIDKNCQCSTCRNYTRAYLHMVIDDAVASSLLSVHNVAYQVRTPCGYLSFQTDSSNSVDPDQAEGALFAIPPTYFGHIILSRFLRSKVLTHF